MDNSNPDYGLSNQGLVRQLGVNLKNYRLARRLSQKEAAALAGVSEVTLRQFENGRKYNISMAGFIGLMRAVGMLDRIGELLPEIPISLYVLAKLEAKKPKRIRT